MFRAEPGPHSLPSWPVLSGQFPTGPPAAPLGGSELPIMGARQTAERGYLPVRIPWQALRDRWGGDEHKKELDGTSWPELSACCPPPPTVPVLRRPDLRTRDSCVKGRAWLGLGWAEEVWEFSGSGGRKRLCPVGLLAWQHTYEWRIMLPGIHSFRHMDKQLDGHT